MNARSALLLAAVLVSCTHAAGNAPPEDAVAPALHTVPATSQALSVAAALTTSSSDELLVEGTFLGFQGPCSGTPPTRSAWHLADPGVALSACIYVAGPLAAGTKSMPAEGIGSRVRVRGTVRELEGTRYLEAREVTR